MSCKPFTNLGNPENSENSFQTVTRISEKSELVLNPKFKTRKRNHFMYFKSDKNAIHFVSVNSFSAFVEHEKNIS